MLKTSGKVVGFSLWLSIGFQQLAEPSACPNRGSQIGIYSRKPSSVLMKISLIINWEKFLIYDTVICDLPRISKDPFSFCKEYSSHQFFGLKFLRIWDKTMTFLRCFFFFFAISCFITYKLVQLQKKNGQVFPLAPAPCGDSATAGHDLPGLASTLATARMSATAQAVSLVRWPFKTWQHGILWIVPFFCLYRFIV